MQGGFVGIRWCLAEFCCIVFLVDRLVSWRLVVVVVIIVRHL